MSVQPLAEYLAPRMNLVMNGKPRKLCMCAQVQRGGSARCLNFEFFMLISPHLSHRFQPVFYVREDMKTSTGRERIVTV